MTLHTQEEPNSSVYATFTSFLAIDLEQRRHNQEHHLRRHRLNYLYHQIVFFNITTIILMLNRNNHDFGWLSHKISVRKYTLLSFSFDHHIYDHLHHKDQIIVDGVKGQQHSRGEKGGGVLIDLGSPDSRFRIVQSVNVLLCRMQMQQLQNYMRTTKRLKNRE